MLCCIVHDYSDSYILISNALDFINLHILLDFNIRKLIPLRFYLPRVARVFCAVLFKIPIIHLYFGIYCLELLQILYERCYCSKLKLVQF